MKNEPARLAQRYVAALKKHLTQGVRASLESAQRFGHQDRGSWAGDIGPG